MRLTTLIAPGARRLITAALAVLGALSLAPPAAQAGTYKMYSCEPPGLNIAVPKQAPWRLFQNNTTTTIDTTTCGRLRGGAMSLSLPRSGAYGIMPANSYAGFELPAAALNPAIGIVRVKSWGATDLRFQGYEPGTAQKAYGYYVSPALTNPPGGVDLLEGHATSVKSPPLASYKMGLVCVNGAGGRPCQLIGQNNFALTAVETDLGESVEPTGTIVGGPLGTPGRKAGQGVLSYRAADGESGIARVEVLLDDVVAGVHDFSRDLTRVLADQTGDCTYTGLAACPTTQAGDLVVDTTKVPDGSRLVTLRVTDAAGNSASLLGSEVTIDNLNGASGLGVANGANASRSARLTARYATTRATTRRLRYSAKPIIRGRLGNEANQGIGAATIAVLVRNRAAGTRERQVATFKTKPDGSFAYRLPPGPSRKITFTYTAFSADAEPSATAVLRTTVRARLSARGARNARVGIPWRIRGRLALLPRANVRVFIQSLDRGNWRTYEKLRTTSGGRFSWRYTFSPKARGKTYAFRVQVDSETYPLAPGVSPYVYVSVR